MTNEYSSKSKADTELFELCKEVERITNWKPTSYYKRVVKVGIAQVVERLPLYTSDYLLEKLPAEIVTKSKYRSSYDFMLKNLTGTWCAVYEWSSSYDVGILYEEDGDTPLLALLKLTKALADAGELQSTLKKEQ